MQLLKSLFCLQGFDNRTRFFAIFSAIYIAFIMLASAFSGQLVISIIISVFFSLVLALSSLRRLHDAKLNKNWLFAPSISFVLTALVIVISQQHSSYYLLLIPVLCSAILLTYPSHLSTKRQTKQQYILGYLGPVDMSEYQQNTHQGKSAKFRIEPSLAGESIVDVDTQQEHSQQTPQYTYQSPEHHDNSNTQVESKQPDIGELIRLKVLSNKKAQVILFSIIILVLVGVFASWVITLFTRQNSEEVAPIEQVKVSNSYSMTAVREYPLVMPDNFTLYLSEHQGIIINWQADEVTTTQLWSQFSAQGDESCQQINFNKGQGFRTLTVDIESKNGANTEYFASFSPLDSQALIQALAFRGTFSLCGYNFSLKGSQAALGMNEQYAQWVNY